MSNLLSYFSKPLSKQKPPPSNHIQPRKKRKISNVKTKKKIVGTLKQVKTQVKQQIIAKRSEIIEEFITNNQIDIGKFRKLNAVLDAKLSNFQSQATDLRSRNFKENYTKLESFDVLEILTKTAIRNALQKKSNTT